VLENRIAEAMAARSGLPEFLDALAAPTRARRVKQALWDR
jgi:hypothetical protein